MHKYERYDHRYLVDLERLPDLLLEGLDDSGHLGLEHI